MATQNGSLNGSHSKRDGSSPAAAGPHSRQSDPGLGWDDLLELAREGRWIIVATTVLVTAMVATYSYYLPPEYEATSVVTIETKNSVRQQRPEVFQLSSSNRSLMNEIANLRLSYDLAERVGERLVKLGEKEGTSIPIAWSNAAPDSPRQRLDAAVSGWFGTEESVNETQKLRTVSTVTNRLIDRVSFTPVDEELDLIRITSSSTSPREAYEITRIYVEEYEARSQELSRSDITSSREFLQGQYQKAQKDLQAAEQRLQSYMVENRAVALDQGAGSAVEQIAKLDAMKDETRIQLELERAALDSLEQEMSEIRPRLSERVASGVDSKLNALQRAKAELEMQKEEMLVVNPSLQEEGNATPRLQKINEQITSLRRQIDTLSKQYVDEVTSVGGVDGNDGGRGLSYFTQLRRKAAERRITISGLEAKLENVEERITEREARLDQIPAQMMNLAELQREKESAERVFTMLQRQLQETKIAAETRPDYVDVLRQADVPSVPVRPHYAKNTVFGLLAGLLLGLVFAAGRRMFDYSIKGPQDLRDRGYRVLGVIPRLTTNGWMSGAAANGKESSSSPLVMQTQPDRPESEAYRGLRMGVRFLPGDHEHRAIMITSPGAGQGKSVTSANLAIALARSGDPTLLVDADLRRPRQHELLDLSRDPGLTDLLHGEAEGTIHSLEEISSSLRALTAGTPVSNPAEMLESGRMKALIEELKGRFKYVIFDTPPVLAVTDAVVLSTLCDTVAVIVDGEDNDHRALRHTVDTLGEVGTRIDGLVMNRFDARSAYGYDRYHYGYASEYRDYYPSTRAE